MRDNFSQYAPIVSQYNPRSYRVIVDKNEDDNYEVFVSDYYVRVFTEDTLPTEIKSKLTMIKAADKEPYPIDQSIYLTSPYEEMREIGWNKVNGLFCVVLSKDVLDELKGKE